MRRMHPDSLRDRFPRERVDPSVSCRSTASPEPVPTRAGGPLSRISRRSPGPVIRVALAAGLITLLAGCASAPPTRQGDLCAVFEQHPDWYDYARDSVAEWGTPVHVLMAFVRHESSYRSDAKPPFEWFLFIPLGLLVAA